MPGDDQKYTPEEGDLAAEDAAEAQNNSVIAGADAGFDEFISDITPFFYNRAITYVDVGAYTGAVFARVQQSALAVREAHLIEPNPRSFESLQAVKEAADPKQSINLYNIAIGSDRSTVRMKDARTMTRIIENDEENAAALNSNTFTVDSVPLDSLSDLFFNRHISILKVDVEGQEKNVLIGAEKLLSQQRVDMVYIEAGADPESVQQCYYRIIDDILMGHGYRLFRIYEQTHEWMTDSPSLRRMNMAYISSQFANANPFKLTRNLHKLQLHNSKLSERLSQLSERLEQSSATHREVQRKRDEAVEHLKASKAREDALTRELTDLQTAKAASDEQIAAQHQAELALALAKGRDRDLIAAQLQESLIRIEALTEHAAQTQASLAEYEERISERTAALSALQEQVVWQESTIQALSSDKAKSEALILALRLQVADRESTGAALRSELDGAQAQSAALQTQLQQARAQVAELASAAEALQKAQARSASDRKRLDRELATLRERLEAKDVIIEERGREISDLRRHSIRLSAIEASTSWRITAPLRALKGGMLAGGATASPTPRAVAPVGVSPIPDARARNTAPTTEIVPPPAAPAPGAPKLAAATPEPAAALSRSPSSTSAKGTRPAKANAPAASNSVKALDDKLWGGFSRRALRELEAIKVSGNQKEAADAAWSLACWYAAEGDLERGRDNAILSRMGKPHDVPRALLEAFCHVRLGDYDAARALLEPIAAKDSNNADVQLALANANATAEFDLPSEAARLALINGVYEKAGLAPLRLKDPSRGLNVDNLTTDPLPEAIDSDRAKISVVVPIYNAVETISFALEGLLNQTWRNLEIIAVDDCSTDRTAEILQAFAYRDPRITILRQNANKGSYTCRNLALTIATGDFITVHDANDWSHPQKLERQAAHLLQNPSIIGNHSNWARVIDNMIFVGKFRRKDKIIDWNPSSFFFRRRLIDLVGGWDRVRISADAELIRRTREAAAARGEVVAIPETAPLAFAYDHADSLTKNSLTHGRTINHGVRREYKEASSHWLSVASRNQLRLQEEARPFPVPGFILPDREKEAACDVLFVADFTLDDASFAATVAEIDAASAMGRNVAVFHWRSFESPATAPLSPSIRQRAQDGKLQVISPGESVTADEVVIAHPAALQDMIDLAPRVTAGSVRVLANRGEAVTNPGAARATLMDVFGTMGEWVPSA